MARGKITQAAAIREALQKLGIDTPSSEVVEYVDGTYRLGLGKKAHAATVVSIERGKLRGGRKKKRVVRRRRPGAARRGGGAGLESAVDFVRQAGGLENAQAMLDQIARIAKLV
jgi:hypothetical protein